MNAERRDANKLAYSKLCTVIAVVEGPAHSGGVRSIPGNVELSMVWIRMRRSAAVVSFGSGDRSVCTSMTNAELTAENRPACETVYE